MGVALVGRVVDFSNKKKIACYEPYLVCSIWKMSWQLHIFKFLSLRERGYTVFQFNLNLTYYKVIIF